MAILIAVEGIDGAGKGTQSRRLSEQLQADGLRSTCIQFPRYSETTFGKAIGDFLNGRFGTLDQVHPQLASVLYAGDRFESMPVLNKAIATHDVVVLDRFTGSNLAHQASKLNGQERNDLIAWITTVESQVFKLPSPDLNILIDITPEWSRQLVSRKGNRDYTDHEADIHESNLSYLAGVRDCYLQLAQERDDWTVVHSVAENQEIRTIDEVAADILAAVNSCLAHSGNS